jgi:hypothetical protein
MMWNRIGQVTREIDDLKFPLSTRELMESVLTVLAAPHTKPYSAAEGLDPDLREFMQQLSKHCHTMPFESSMKANMIWPHVMDHFERLREWICGIYDVADRELASEIVRALEKVFALHSGTHMAYLYLTLGTNAKLDETLTVLDRVMIAGV